MLDVGYISSDRTSVSGNIASQVSLTMSASATATSSVAAPKSVNDIDIVTPYIRVDDNVKLAILEYRSSKTGDVKRQYPSEEQIRAFQEAERIRVSSEERARATKSSSSMVNQVSTVKETSVEVDVSVKTSAPSDISVSSAVASYAAASNAGISIDTSSFGGAVQTATSMLI